METEGRDERKGDEKKGIKTGREMTVKRGVSKEKEMTKKQTEERQRYSKI